VPFLRRRAIDLTVLGLAATVFLYFWYTHEGRAGLLGLPFGWFHGVDQGNYLREAEYLARGRIPNAANYAYGLGYPVLAAPFDKLGLKGDPFVPVDLFSYCFIVYGTYRLGARLFTRNVGLVACGLAGVVSPLLNTVIIPWNTTVTTVAVIAIALVVTSSQRGVLGGLVLGVALGFTFAARFLDAAFLAVLAVPLLFDLRKNLVMLISAVASSAFIVGLVLWTQDVAFGSPFTTPYSFHTRPGGVSDQSFSSFSPGRIVTDFVGDFITGRYHGARQMGDPYLRVAPWLVLVPVGMFFVVRRGNPHRAFLICAIVASVVSSCAYLSFRAGTVLDLAFQNVRYFVAWMPMWALFACYGASVLWSYLPRAPSETTPTERAAVP